MRFHLYNCCDYKSPWKLCSSSLRFKLQPSPRGNPWASPKDIVELGTKPNVEISWVSISGLISAKECVPREFMEQTVFSLFHLYWAGLQIFVNGPSEIIGCMAHLKQKNGYNLLQYFGCLSWNLMVQDNLQGKSNLDTFCFVGL